MAPLFFLWGVFSTYLTVGTMGTNRVSQLTFVALTAVLFLLSAAEATASGEAKLLAGILGILAGSLAVYSAMAQVLNEALGREAVPLFKVERGVSAKPEGSAAE